MILVSYRSKSGKKETDKKFPSFRVPYAIPIGTNVV